MGQFIDIAIRERLDGAPGFLEAQEFNVSINKDHITLYNKGEEDGITFVRLTCGATLCVLMPVSKFVQLLNK